MNETSALSQTRASQNDLIKLKISQRKVYLSKQHKGSNDPVKQCNKYYAMIDCHSEMSADESSIFLFIYLFGVLRHFQHCTGHIMTGSWKGR